MCEKVSVLVYDLCVEMEISVFGIMSKGTSNLKFCI